MKGSYILILKLDRDMRIKIGKLGIINFKKGYYAYVGSALNNLEKRIGRHLSDNKRFHWHIDYLIDKGKITDIFIKTGDEKEECRIARYLLSYFTPVKGFGSSDCKCESHLFYSRNKKDIVERVKSIGMVMFGGGEGE